MAATTVRLDLAATRRWALAARTALAEARTHIDALNVFPVPDGDTGTNMYLTVDGALEVLRGHYQAGSAPQTLEEGLGVIARGMLLSARGNSGVILSQLSRGLHEAVAAAGPVQEVTPPLLADAFARADTLAWTAVSSPVEGTILSVSRAAARGAADAATGGGDLLTVAHGAVTAAEEALHHTPQQLPVLAEAGVVDAGAAGLVVLVKALVTVLSDSASDTAEVRRWLEEAAAPASPASPPELDGVGDGAYEVMYLLSGSDPERVAGLRAHLAHLGSSVLVAGGPEQWRVHVHLDHPDAAVEAGAVAGHVEQVSVTALPGGTGARPAPGPEATPEVGVVACSPGPGFAALFAEAGAQVVRSSPGARASTGQLLSACWAVGARTVLLLPNDPDTVLAARAAAGAAHGEGLEVHVIPSAAAVQGLAAMAVWDPAAPGPEAAAAMTEAAAATRHGAVTRAVRDARTPAGPCRAGQPLGLVDGAIVVVADEVAGAARRVLEELCGPDTELLTVVRGAGAQDDLQPALADLVARHPALEVTRLEGGQDAYLWLFGAE